MLFRLADVSKAYGAQDVLRAISFQLNPGEHVGLVGRNGAGKTTILRLIDGTEGPDSGTIETLKGLRVGVLGQQVDFTGELSVLDQALSVFVEVGALAARMEQLEHAMTELQGTALDEVLEEYSEVQHAFEHAGGFTLRSRAESVLFGLGFSKSELNNPSSTLSGGEKNRLGLAQLLLAEPDILLLDEPTNHLDVEAVEWLEDFLAAYKSAYLVVSHDRFFLDQTVERILDLDNGRLENYRGNYSAYLIQREERMEARATSYSEQREMIARTEEFIRRNLAGQKTKQAKSRRKMLERLERVEAVSGTDQTNFKLRPSVRTGDRVLSLEHLDIGYPDLPDRRFSNDLTLLLRRGERLGVIGGNGTGKTTFLRTITGKLKPLKGEANWGSGVSIGYYDQQLKTVDARNTVLEEMRSIASASITDGELRGFLGRFLFSGDDVFKVVAALSGGEKGRLALAKLIYSRANVLLLDEPTNHLDIASREALETALNEYDGTILTVSHDRYFLDRIATRILYFAGDHVEAFNGGYTEFYEIHHRKTQPDVEPTKPVPDTKKRGVSASNRSKKSASPSKSKRRTAADIEAEIHTREGEMRDLSEQLASTEIASDWEKLHELNEKYRQADARLTELMELWEAAQHQEMSDLLDLPEGSDASEQRQKGAEPS